jgi:integrase
VHPKIVSERLGHATVSLTLHVYSHAVGHMQAESAEQIAGIIFPGGDAARSKP